MARSRSWSSRSTLTPLGRLLPNTGPVALRRAWRQAVGPQGAARSEVIGLEGGVLRLRVASSVWAQELSLLAPVLLSRLSASGVTVERIAFRVERLLLPKDIPPAPVAVTPVALPSELRERLARLEDPRLRDAIAGAAAYTLGRKRGPGRA